jgi:hydrogenase maturation protease
MINSSRKNVSKDCGLSRADVKIIGFGNKFRSDDGIGIRIINELEKLEFFKDIEIIDGGTSGTDLIFWAKNCEKIIIIDAIDTGKNTGDVINIKIGDIEEFIRKDYRSLSLHDLNLADVLKLIKALGINTRISIIGIKPRSIDFGDKLSPEIERKIPELISEIKKEAGR